MIYSRTSPMFISALNVCHTHFYCAHKCKGTNLERVLFNVLQWHKTLRPILDSVTGSLTMSSAVTVLSKLTCPVVAVVLQVVTDTPKRRHFLT